MLLESPMPGVLHLLLEGPVQRSTHADAEAPHGASHRRPRNRVLLAAVAGARAQQRVELALSARLQHALLEAEEAVVRHQLEDDVLCLVEEELVDARQVICQAARELKHKGTLDGIM